MKTILSALFMCSFGASAAVISVIVPEVQVTLGSQVAIEVRVGEVANLAAPSISGYSVRLGFDPTILAPSSIVFGVELDLGSGSSQVFSSTVDSIVIQEFSFAPAADLINLQPGLFPLATLTFDTIAPGTSALLLTVSSLLDQDGIRLSATVANGEISVATAAIPEPALSGVVGVALTLLFCLRRRNTALPRL